MHDSSASTQSTLAARLIKMKAAFSNYNVVRMREALRYLSGPKLELFIKIPFLIHMNRPHLPGYVPEKPEACGIYNFENSGFYKAVLDNEKDFGDIPDTETQTSNPCVLGFYHIGSLGTFTQSAQSDFDYWIIIDKTCFTEQRYYNLEKKLNHIVKFSRENFDQEVTFFIMDQADIRQNCYAGYESPETMIAPKLFLKEEFYRTFLMIAGKIPMWTILPANMQQGTYDRLVRHLFGQPDLEFLLKDFIDLGKVEMPALKDIYQGIGWHICKSKEDPVKALLKATMILSHITEEKDNATLLCDDLKQKFAKAGIDDCESDPYKIVFDRVLHYHKTHAHDTLKLIKIAIFFRLCSYPKVRLPEPGSPKKQLIDKYIRTWNILPSQIRKLMSYPNWPEKEKQALDTTLIQRLAGMYHQIRAKEKDLEKNLKKDMLRAEQRNLKILNNKVKERLNTKPGKIPASSNFLTRHSFSLLMIRKNLTGNWILSAALPNTIHKSIFHTSESFLGLMGWIMENRLYQRHRTQIKLESRLVLYENKDQATSPDALYLVMQPVKPLSDSCFEHDARWNKILILLVCPDQSCGVAQAELLALNSWGELFLDHLELDTGRPLHDRYKDVADKISLYAGEEVRLFFFQMAEIRDEHAVYGIKQFLADRFLIHRPGTPKQNRPMLDKL
ncbi:class I adenylate cyclase [uncultured Desulfobacter sp.]|uniref:class I adenylate cyclase n=1 Tax=uncultured Desulfobacter sp. TaxID=240139 RepID=UPI002AAC19A4|nr:class I adenylate cyclase [uncultured Desulfobacter sp.]